MRSKFLFTQDALIAHKTELERKVNYFCSNVLEANANLWQKRSDRIYWTPESGTCLFHLDLFQKARATQEKTRKVNYGKPLQGRILVKYFNLNRWKNLDIYAVFLTLPFIKVMTKNHTLLSIPTIKHQPRIISLVISMWACVDYKFTL